MCLFVFLNQFTRSNDPFFYLHSHNLQTQQVNIWVLRVFGLVKESISSQIATFLCVSQTYFRNWWHLHVNVRHTHKVLTSESSFFLSVTLCFPSGTSCQSGIQHQKFYFSLLKRPWPASVSSAVGLKKKQPGFILTFTSFCIVQDWRPLSFVSVLCAC